MMIDKLTKTLPMMRNNKKWFTLPMLSVINELPIAQFIVDKYMECARISNWTVNEFMTTSKLFSPLNRDNNEYKLIRNYLSHYLKYCYMPIPGQGIANNHQRHKLSNICNYLSVIHSSIYRLNKVRQTDIYFVHSLHGIDDQYFIQKHMIFDKLRGQ